MAYTVEQLTQAIQDSWAKDSLSDDGTGQCISVALLVQDYFGGFLARWRAKGGPHDDEIHYFNMDVPNHGIVDLTMDQYPDDQVFVIAPLDIEIRDYVLRDPENIRLYRQLEGNVAIFLAELTDMMAPEEEA